ncbi:MAG: hypothetical protein LPK19_00190, partial [Hymenobacteraceae bacterium]|nr:hypothetical protein [Hymenobacteraceae bacterium]MDX5394586.1 hypothetical protein [Hymenobacteraceae bacterium]MDX5510612.1 hypothetical protein [Hymenobacteraceae bacterium]
VRGKVTDDKFKERLDRVFMHIASAYTTDLVTNGFGIFSIKEYKKQDYEFVGEQLWGKDTVYVINFSRKLTRRGKEQPGSIGTLYIHTASLAVVAIESVCNQADLDNFNNSWDYKLSVKLSKCKDSRIIAQSSKMIYQEHNGKWHLNQAFSKMVSYSDCADYKTPQTEKSYTQVVVTGINTTNPQPIPENEQSKLFRNYYSSSPQDFNEQFWEQYNVVELPPAFAESQLQNAPLESKDKKKTSAKAE